MFLYIYFLFIYYLSIDFKPKSFPFFILNTVYVSFFSQYDKINIYIDELFNKRS